MVKPYSITYDSFKQQPCQDGLEVDISTGEMDVIEKALQDYPEEVLA